jgi:hypothetical protein
MEGGGDDTRVAEVGGTSLPEFQVLLAIGFWAERRAGDDRPVPSAGSGRPSRSI